MKSAISEPEPSDVSPKQLRTFGLLVGSVFAIIALWPLIVRQESMRGWALIPTGILILGALVYPQGLRPLFKGWMKVGHVLGFINTRILLSLGFFVIFTPIGLVRRLLGKDSLHRKLDPNQSTYRSPRQSRVDDHMSKQY